MKLNLSVGKRKTSIELDLKAGNLVLLYRDINVICVLKQMVNLNIEIIFSSKIVSV